jgi:hypothetical protein
MAAAIAPIGEEDDMDEDGKIGNALFPNQAGNEEPDGAGLNPTFTSVLDSKLKM